MEKEKKVSKNNNFKVIILTIIACAIICIPIGIIIGGKFFYNEKLTTDNKEKHEQKENETKDETQEQNVSKEYIEIDSSDSEYNKIIAVHTKVAVIINATKNMTNSELSINDKVLMIIGSLNPDVDNVSNIDETIASSDGTEVTARLCTGAYSEKMVKDTIKEVFNEDVSFDNINNQKLYFSDDIYYSSFIMFNKENGVFAYYSKPLDSPFTCNSENWLNRNTVEKVMKNNNSAIVYSMCAHCMGYKRKYTFTKKDGNYYFESLEIEEL